MFKTSHCSENVHTIKIHQMKLYLWPIPKAAVPFVFECKRMLPRIALIAFCSLILIVKSTNPLRTPSLRTCWSIREPNLREGSGHSSRTIV